MYSNIVSAIRGEIRKELISRTRGNRFLFRETDENGEEHVYSDICVGFPEENGYFSDVVSVQRKGNDTLVTVRDSCGFDRGISIDDIELSVSDLSFILDAIIDGKPVITE